MRHCACLRLLLAWLILGSTANAGPDQVQIDMAGRYPLPLRWDNVIGAPLWVAGPKPFAGRSLRRKAPERPENCLLYTSRCV